ncbi:MAG: hypothetical protein Q4P66_05640 [Actinomycetaceae bacterium]|nr:hypothetical protein [Actinomycetaceae bacterium]
MRLPAVTPEEEFRAAKDYQTEGEPGFPVARVVEEHPALELVPAVGDTLAQAKVEPVEAADDTVPTVELGIAGKIAHDSSDWMG